MNKFLSAAALIAGMGMALVPLISDAQTSGGLSATVIYPNNGEYVSSSEYTQSPSNPGAGGGVAASSSRATGIKSTSQMQVRMGAASSGGTGNASSSAHVLPTANKITEEAAVRGWDPKHKEIIIGSRQAIGLAASSTATVHIAPEAIQNADDLKILAAQTMKSDENIESISMNASGTEIGYDVPGKLFWFIPVHMTARVHVVSGRVKVQFPWYRMLIASSLNLNDDDINLALSEKLQTMMGVKPQDDLQMQAREFVTITNILKARHDASQQAISNIK